MKNTVFIFDTQTVAGTGIMGDNRTGFLKIPLYDGVKINRAKSILQSLDPNKYFGILRLSNNITLDKISWQIYKSPDYWDILLLINDIDPLFGMPYDYDVVSDSTDTAIDRYTKKIFKRHMSDKDRQRLHDALASQDSIKNEAHVRIYYVYPERIYEVRQMLYEQGVIYES